MIRKPTQEQLLQNKTKKHHNYTFKIKLSVGQFLCGIVYVRYIEKHIGLQKDYAVSALQNVLSK